LSTEPFSRRSGEAPN